MGTTAIEQRIAQLEEQVGQLAAVVRVLSRRDDGVAHGLLPWRPLEEIAAHLGWEERQLTTFCRKEGVAIRGTRKGRLVDPTEVSRAIAATGGPTQNASSVDAAAPANSAPDRETELLARSGIRLERRRSGGVK